MIPIFMWLPLTKFTHYSQKAFTIDHQWVLSYKSTLYYHVRVKLIFMKIRRPFVPYFGVWVKYVIAMRLWWCAMHFCNHYSDAIMSAMACQMTGISIVYWNVSSGADQRKHQSSASLAFMRGIHRWQLNSPYKGAATRKMFSLDDVIIILRNSYLLKF